jgi:hypothetical protein
MHFSCSITLSNSLLFHTKKRLNMEPSSSSPVPTTWAPSSCWWTKKSRRRRQQVQPSSSSSVSFERSEIDSSSSSDGEPAGPIDDHQQQVKVTFIFTCMCS